MKWLKSALGRVKLNIDVHSKGNPGPSGGGAIIRDHMGILVVALADFYTASLPT